MKCGDICTGDLRQKVELYHKSLTSDGRGGFTETWTKYATARARVDTPSASVRFFAKGHEDVLTHMFLVRYRSDIESTDILVWRGEVYDTLRAVDIEGRKKWTQLDAQLMPRADLSELTGVTFNDDAVTFDSEAVTYA